MRMKKTLALTVVAVLALSACGGDSDDSDDDTSNAAGPKTADIRVWLNGADTPQDARDWLKTTFEEQNAGSTLTIEEQQWEGLVEKLTTSLSSDDTPDVVEVGNTQAPTFTGAGAFSDLTDQVGNLGGDDLLQGFLDSGSVEGKTYAVPYYAGSKYVFYRKDLLEKANLTVPTTMEEFVTTAIALKKDNPQPGNFSGFWLPGQDWRNGVTFLWDAGGDLAVQDGDEWKGSLSSPESIAGLTTVQKLFQEASGAAKDGNEANPEVPFCNNEIAMFSAPGWQRGVLESPDTGCPALVKKVGVFALPGSDGSPAPVLLGGSNIAVAAKSQNQDLAEKAVALMLSDDYQKILAQNGLTPAKTSLAGEIGTDEFAQATIAAAQNAKLTPAAAGWASVEGARILEDLFVAIANGGDVEQLAKEADEKITEQLN